MSKSACILILDDASQAVGAGFLADKKHIVTTKSVLERAFGKTEEEISTPGEKITLNVQFPFLVDAPLIKVNLKHIFQSGLISLDIIEEHLPNGAHPVTMSGLHENELLNHSVYLLMQTAEGEKQINGQLKEINEQFEFHPSSDEEVNLIELDGALVFDGAKSLERGLGILQVIDNKLVFKGLDQLEALKLNLMIVYLSLPTRQDILDRDEYRRELKARLIERRNTRLAGDSGTGKSSLANFILHDPEIQAAYHGGIIWLDIEQDGSVNNINLSQFAYILGIERKKFHEVLAFLRQDPSTIEDNPQWRALREEIMVKSHSRATRLQAENDLGSPRYGLIVLDNPPNPQVAELFRAEEFTYLIISNYDLWVQESIELNNGMEETAALKFFNQMLGNAANVITEREKQNLLQRARYVPQAIISIANIINDINTTRPSDLVGEVRDLENQQLPRKGNVSTSYTINYLDGLSKTPQGKETREYLLGLSLYQGYFSVEDAAKILELDLTEARNILTRLRTQKILIYWENTYRFSSTNAEIFANQALLNDINPKYRANYINLFTKRATENRNNFDRLDFYATNLKNAQKIAQEIAEKLKRQEITQELAQELKPKEAFFTIYEVRFEQRDARQDYEALQNELEALLNLFDNPSTDTERLTFAKLKRYQAALGFRQGKLKEIEEICEEGLKLLNTIEDSAKRDDKEAETLRGRLYLILNASLARQGNFDEAEKNAQKAKEHAITASDSATLHKASFNEITAFYDQGYYARAEQMALDAQGTFEKLDLGEWEQRELTIDILKNIGTYCATQRKYESALEKLQKARLKARIYQISIVEFEALLNIIYLSIRQTNYGHANKLIKELKSLFDTSQPSKENFLYLPYLEFVEGEVMADNKKYREMEEKYRTVQTKALKIGNANLYCTTRLSLSKMYRVQQQYDEAIKALTQGIDEIEAPTLLDAARDYAQQYVGPIHYALARLILLDKQDYKNEKGWYHLNSALDYIETKDGREALKSDLLTLKGQISAAQEQYSDAEQYFTEAIELSEQHGLLESKAEALRAWADMQGNRGNIADQKEKDEQSNAAYRAIYNDHAKIKSNS